MELNVNVIYHIALEDDFAMGKESGLYQCASLKGEGFIHCSLKEQLLDVANFIFKGQQGLMLMEINSDMVVPEIRYENLEGGTKLFPHIYGILNMNSLVRNAAFVPDSLGLFTFPSAFLCPDM